jgi:predicted heme/steroid binding protein
LRVEVDHSDFEPFEKIIHGCPERFGSAEVENANGAGPSWSSSTLHGGTQVGDEIEEVAKSTAAHFPSEVASLPTVGDAAEIEKHGGKMLKKLKWGKAKS